MGSSLPHTFHQQRQLLLMMVHREIGILRISAPSNVSKAPPPTSHFLLSPHYSCEVLLDKGWSLICTNTKSSTHFGVILFFLIEFIKEEVLQFLLQQQEENSGPSNLNARFKMQCRRSMDKPPNVWVHGSTVKYWIMLAKSYTFVENLLISNVHHSTIYPIWKVSL